MSNPESLKHLCLNDQGTPKTQNECRAAIINFLILEEMMDMDAAEDLAEQTLRESGYWPEEKNDTNGDGSPRTPSGE